MRLRHLIVGKLLDYELSVQIEEDQSYFGEKKVNAVNLKTLVKQSIHQWMS